MQQMVKQACAEFHINTTGGVGKHVTAQTRQRDFEDRHHQQTRRNHIQRGQPVMHQHLVHDHLEEQRRNQREQVEHERHQQHFTQQLAIFDNSGDEPGEVELRHFADHRRARGEQDELTTPARQ